MGRIGLVAWHVLKEGVRDRVLYAIGGFALLLVATSVLIGQITAGQDLKIIKDLGLATLELSGVLMAILIGVGLVAREIDRRTIYGVLAKPIERWEFIAGKYAGLVLTLAVNVAAMTAALYLMLAIMSWTATPEARAAWITPPCDPRLLGAIGLILVELALLTAVALFFSTFSSSALMSTVFTLGLWVAGVFNADLRGVGDAMPSRVIGQLVTAVASALPAFSAFDIKDQVVRGETVPMAYLAMTIAYGVLYAAGTLVASMLVFSRREFK